MLVLIDEVGPVNIIYGGGGAPQIDGRVIPPIISGN